MRVIAGKYKRRNLCTPVGIDITRPTSDRTKESLFNILGTALQGAFALDLFAGSGALGIEALSRGASHVIFVESHSVPLKCLVENLKNLGVPAADYTVIQLDVDQFLTDYRAAFISLRNSGVLNAERFAASIDFVFADPPYASQWYDRALDSIDKSGLCSQECLLVVEKLATHKLFPQCERWKKDDDRVYGKTRIEFWKHTSRGEECANLVVQT